MQDRSCLFSDSVQSAALQGKCLAQLLCGSRGDEIPGKMGARSLPARKLPWHQVSLGVLGKEEELGAIAHDL